MQSETVSCSVAELVQSGELFVEDGNHGEYRPLAHEFSKAGTPFIRPDNLVDGELRFDGCDRINEVATRRVRKGKGKAGDIVFTHRATVGRIARVGPAAPDFVANPGVTVWRVTDNSRIDRNYLYYYMQSAAFMDQVWSMAGGTDTFPYISLTQQRTLRIDLVPLPEQKAIGALLGTLDDRIGLLRQSNATLEAISKSLFKSWFIDFDAVLAKAEGREPEGMDAATAALFPAEFEESQLGLIPKGWGVVPFAETVNIMGGGTPKTSVAKFWGGDVPWFSVVDAPDFGQVFTLRTDKSITTAGVENSSTRVLPAWTTIISARGTVGKLAMTACPMAMNQSCYGLVPKLSGTEPLVYLAAQRLVDDLKRLAHGGVFDTITRDTLSSVDVVYGPSDVRASFAAMVKPMFEQIQEGVARMCTLAELRDALLPRLISGKLRLPAGRAEQLEGATV